MASKAEQRRNTITEFLESNPGNHTAEAIAEACGLTVADTNRALGQLVKSDVIAETEPNDHGAAQWTLAQAETTEAETDEAAPKGDDAVQTDPAEEDTKSESGLETEPGASGEETASEKSGLPEQGADGQSSTREEVTQDGSKTEPAGSDDPTGPGAVPEGDDQPGETDDDGESAGNQHEDEADGIEPRTAEPDVHDDGDGAADAAAEGEDEPDSVPDPDPAVLLLAGQLAGIEGPVGLEAITLAAFKVAGPKQTETALHALCALAEHDAVKCSDPFAPDDRDRDDKVTWTVLVKPGELDAIAAVAQLADAPHATVCPTCRTEIALPHPKGVGRTKSGSNGRIDGRRRLADGELRQMLISLIKENPGEELKPGDFVRELKNDPRFADRVSANPSGAVRSALIALERKENGEWVAEIENRMPLTYRCREAQ
ncbi:hypothetical protein L0U85_03860 [Glycomyces sp. L485]|uniref:hypothetical protein n=1 Tax=Glycomyces sp. L485 TaxID=2909235 RepID=UPI001F4AD642|nr:hypothetical protein [Glycomyces sp. L485]MCH7229998.1 hypothetical protein [Glycomyces sp. L485]